jgi:methylthioribose-1-phosphate isomerase
MIKTISCTDYTVIMIDQNALPHEEKYLTSRSYMDVITAIRNMTIRGAPAIGVAAAMGIALGMLGQCPTSEKTCRQHFTGYVINFPRRAPRQ